VSSHAGGPAQAAGGRTGGAPGQSAGGRSQGLAEPAEDERGGAGTAEPSAAPERPRSVLPPLPATPPASCVGTALPITKHHVAVLAPATPAPLLGPSGRGFAPAGAGPGRAAA